MSRACGFRCLYERTHTGAHTHTLTSSPSVRVQLNPQDVLKVELTTMASVYVCFLRLVPPTPVSPRTCSFWAVLTPP